jgi:hypothetical protein
MFPLIGPGDWSVDYLTLDEALKTRTASVSEVSSSGSVRNLKFLNDGDKPVFLLDGEELVGAKQNRILNLSILAPEHDEIIIPVSCVEQGRWSNSSEKFRSSDEALFSKGRATNASMVSCSLAEGMPAMSDQHEVWRHVAQKSADFNVQSRSGAMSDIFKSVKPRTDQFVRAFQQTDEQLGAVFVIGDRIAGVDVFDKPSTLGKLLPKLVRSYALDALDDNNETVSENTGRAVEEFLETVGSLETSPSPGVGMGEDHRFTGDAVAGGVLVNDGDVIHLCAFPLVPETKDERQSSGLRMTRFQNRRRRA